MLHVLLLILKITGIVIACILGLVIIVVAAVLFVPVRYKADADYHGKFKAHAKLSWLGILRVLVSYDEELAKADTIKLPIQINGKTRGFVEVDANANEKEVLEAAKNVVSDKLTGEIAEYYDIYYRVHAQNVGWMNWAKNGERSGTEGQKKRLEAIEVVLVEKGQQPPQRNNMNTNLSFIDRTGWQIIDGKKYYIYEDGSRAKYIAKIDGRRYEFTANGELQHENIKLVADVSAHNQGIDWDSLWRSGEIDGVIVRVSAGTDYVDSRFQENMRAITRLNIPYGFYIYSYAENYDEGKKYAEHVNKVAENYLSNATLGVYFDLESNVITKHLNTNDYDGIVKGFIDVIPQAKIYTYTDYSQNVLNSDYLLNLTTWIANYAVSDCPGNYQGWQYTSKGRVTGIPTNVDLSIFYY